MVQNPLLTALVISSEIPWIFDIFQIPDSILPYYGHSGKALSKTADYSCKTARFSIRKLSSTFPVAPPKSARFAPSCAILQSPNFTQKVRKTLFFIFPTVPSQAGKKERPHSFLKTVRPIYYWMIFTLWALNSYWRCSLMAACAVSGVWRRLFIPKHSHSSPPICKLSYGLKSCKCTSSHRR